MHSYENAEMVFASISKHMDGSVLSSARIDTRWKHHCSLTKYMEMVFNLYEGESAIDLRMGLTVLPVSDHDVNKVKLVSAG